MRSSRGRQSLMDSQASSVELAENFTLHPILPKDAEDLFAALSHVGMKTARLGTCACANGKPGSNSGKYIHFALGATTRGALGVTAPASEAEDEFLRLATGTITMRKAMPEFTCTHLKLQVPFCFWMAFEFARRSECEIECVCVCVCVCVCDVPVCMCAG